MVLIVVAVVATPVLTVDVGLRPSVKAVAAAVGTAAPAGAVVAGAEVAAVDPRGLSVKVKPPLAAVVAAVADGVAPNMNPVVAMAVEAAVGAVVVMIGLANRDGPETDAVWVDAGGGAGVVEGLIPKLNPPLWVVGAAVVEAAGAPKLKPPPEATVGAAAEVTWTLLAPKLNPPPNDMPPAVVGAAGAAVCAAGGVGCAWEAAPKVNPPPPGAGALVCADSRLPRVNPEAAAGAAVEPRLNPVAAVV